MKFIGNFLKGFWLIAIIYLAPYLLSIPLLRYTNMFGLIEPTEELGPGDYYFWLPILSAMFIFVCGVVVVIVYYLGEAITDVMNERKDEKNDIKYKQIK